MAHHVIISIASNRNQKYNLAQARKYLDEMLLDTTYTKEMWTEAYGEHNGTIYLNQLVYATCESTASELVSRLKQTETIMGRTENDRRMGIVEIDLDLMRFDHQRFHLTDWERPYIQELVLEIDNSITHR
jgi:2-amino-4-hydroxy-6-hydroxymethyldihydropteridine diphosphokinase